MTLEYRTPREDEREAVLDLMQSAFGTPRSFRERFGAQAVLDRYLCAYDGGELVATSQAHPLQQHFGGAPLPMAGIASVATSPDRRGRGTGGALVAELLRRRREAGDVLSTLYPATVAVYRKLGYELAGTFTELSAPLAALPRAGGEGVELETVRDGARIPDLHACYRAWALGHSGPVWIDDDVWWANRVMRLNDPESNPQAVLAQGPDGLEGYACFTRGDRPGFGTDPTCTHLVAGTRRAAEALFAYFGGFHSIGDTLKWHGPPNEPLAVLLAESRSVKATWTFPWMTRILDVPGALEARGYPEADGEVVIAVDDPVFPDNAGPFRIEASAGKVRVTRVDGPAARPIGIGALSSMFTGYLSAPDAVRLGELSTDDPAGPVLGRLFAGPPPWMPDFF
jgi:predicted acetyltransferase